MSAYQQQQLPNNPPIVLRPSVTPQFEQFAPLITGWAMLEAINSAPKTPIRQAYYQALTQNNWQNPLFQTLVNATGQYAEYLVAHNRASPQHAIQACAGECSAMLTAVFVQQNAAHFQQLLQDPAAVQQLNQLLGKFSQIDQQISQFYNSMQARAASPQPMYNQPPVYGGTPIGAGSYGGTPVGGGGAGYPGYGNAYPPAGGGNAILASSTRGGTPTLGAFAPPEPISNAPNAMLIGGKSGSIIESLHMSPKAEATRTTPAPVRREELVAYVPGQTVVAQPAAPAPAPAVEMVNAPQVVDTPVVLIEQPWVKFGDLEWPKVRDLNRPFDAMLQEDGTELQYALTSPWSADYTVDQPYPTAYNPDTHVRLLARAPDGKVSEMFVEKDATMKYLDHELDRAAASRHAASEKRFENIGVDLHLLASLRNIDTHPLSVAPVVEENAEPAEVVDSNVKAVSIKEAILADTLAHTHSRLNLLLSKNAVADDVPYEYYVDLITPKVVLADSVDTLEKLGTTDTYMALISKIGQLDEEEIIELVEARMTEAINRVLKHNLGLADWKVGSFIEDYEELITLFRADFGDDFVRTFEESAVEVIGSALTVSLEERIINYGMNKLGIVAEDMANTDYQMVCFVTRVSVTQLPWRLDELRVGLVPDRDAAVRASELPELRQALEAIMTRTEDLPRVHAHRYLLTTDDQVLEVYKGYLAKDAILLGISETDYNDM